MPFFQIVTVNLSFTIVASNKIHSHVEIEITQSFETKLVDGMELSLMCIAEFDKQFNLTYSIVDMHWTGKKSLWIYHPAIIKQEDRYQRELHFRPWLELNAGEYTCHVVIKSADNHIYVINKTIEVKSKYIIFSYLHAVVSVLCVTV